VDDETVQLGELIETARQHQRLAEDGLRRLAAHLRRLDEVVREEIRCVLVQELQALGHDSQCAVEALRGLKRAANLRVILWSIATALLSSAIPLVATFLLLPSPRQIAALGARRDELQASIARLEKEGGRVDLRRCGAGRFCVRIDRTAPAYGEAADYFVVRGY